MQGLAQSNNNARLNYSAKHVIEAARNKVQKLSKGMGAKEKHKREEQGAAGAHTWASCVMRPNEVTSFLFPFFCLFVSVCFLFFFRRNSQTDYMSKGIQMSKLPHTLLSLSLSQDPDVPLYGRTAEATKTFSIEVDQD